MWTPNGDMERERERKGVVGGEEQGEEIVFELCQFHLLPTHGGVWRLGDSFDVMGLARHQVCK